MLVNFLVLAFVDAFVAIAVLGHVLLLLAIWPVGPNRPNGIARGGDECRLRRESSAVSPAALAA